MSMFEMFQMSNWTLWGLAFCSIIAIFVFIQKGIQLHRAQVNVDELVSGLINVLQRDGMIEAITLCDYTPGPVARLLMAAIHAYQNNDDIKEALEVQSQIEVPKLESHLNVLATIAYATPLLGLLGTVLGMMDVFQALDAGGAAATLKQIAPGIKSAMYCTALSLVIAIPCHIAYNYLLSRIQDFCTDMEKASAEIMYFFKHHKRVEKAK